MESEVSEISVLIRHEYTGKPKFPRNIIVLCVVWVCTFTAYSGLQNLESSLNPDIGVFSLAALAGGGFVSCVLAPVLIEHIGTKGSLVFSWVCLCIFVASNYYPVVYILIPGSLIEGFATGLMWTTHGTYLTSTAISQASLSFEDPGRLLNKYFGIFCASFQSTQIWGNLISSFVLQREVGSTQYNNSAFQNVTMHCGIYQCPGSYVGATTEPSSNKDSNLVNILISVYLVLAIIGLVITILFLESLPKHRHEEHSGCAKFPVKTLQLLLTNKNMALLVPFCMFTGLDQAVMYAEYTKAFVTCELDVSWIGYTMVCFGVTTTLGSPACWLLSNRFGRLFLLYVAATLNVVTLVIMFTWIPKKETIVMFFVVPALWGLADAIWQTQNGVLIGMAFPDDQEPAFANLHLFQALGFTVAYLYSNYLCQSTKLWIVAAMLAITMLLVTVVEIRLKKNLYS